MSFSRPLRLFASLLLAGTAPAVMAQTRGPAGAGRATTPAPPSQATPMTVMLSGNVINENGAPLPGPVWIERVCAGRVSRDGRSDFKGYFTITVNLSSRFQFGDPEGSAETSSGSVNSFGMPNSRISQTNSSTALSAALSGCELRASLAGFRSSSVRIPLEGLGTEVGPVSVGTIVLQSAEQAQGVTVSATSLNVPKDARKAYDKGEYALRNKNKVPEAQQDLERAVQLYPKYAAAWQDLGLLYVQQNQLDKARNAFEQARAADSMFVPAYVGLSSVALRESRWAEAADLSARATQLDGVGFPGAFYFNAFANYRLGNMDQAEKSARKAESLGAQQSFPQVSLLLGAMLANRGDYGEAADRLRSYLKAAPTAPNAQTVRRELAEIEKREAAESKPQAAPPAK